MKPTWALAVTADKTTALIVVCPVDVDSYNAMATRMRAAGAARVTAHDFVGNCWPHSRTSAVDVVAGNLVRATTGKTSFYTGRESDPPLDVSPAWQDAAWKRGRVMFGVVPPGTLTGGADQLAEAVAAGTLVGCAAVARFDLPVRRPA